MSARSIPRTPAISSLAHGLPRENAAAVVDEVYRPLADPDAEMVDAGIAELDRFALDRNRGTHRAIVEAIWRAMFEKARS